MQVQIIDNTKKLREKKKVIRKITEELLGFLGIKGKTLNILFTDDEGIREINLRFLNKDRPTNVISFSYFEEGQSIKFPEETIGDIVISVERASAEARKIGCSFYERLFQLVIHGIVHILGYDHEKGEKEKRRMRSMEKKLEDFLRSLPSYGGLLEFDQKKIDP